MGREYLSKSDLEHIKTHKYTTTGYSWLDNKMNPFWIKSAELLPHWLSPNMVTMIGLFVLTLGVIFIIPFDSTMSTPLPTWLYIVFAIFVFLGQTLDAIDGKHARNTGRSSPLGQLMDHGCDAFSNSFVVIMIIQAHTMGNSVYTVVVQILVQISFYVITWEEHHTGVLLTHINNLGVTEFQFIGMGIILLPALLGNEISHFRIISKGPFSFTIAELLVFVNGFLSIKTSLERLIINFKTKEDLLKKFYPMYSLIILIVAELLASQLYLYKTHTIYLLILNGLYFGFMTSKLIVCNMSKRPIENFCWDNLLYLVVVLTSILMNNFNFEMFAIGICAFILVVRYLSFMFGVSLEIMKYLNISF